MRRHDREVTDPVKIDAVFAECQVCRLGLRDGEAVYVVPLNFGFVTEGGERRLYFHCAQEGRKLALIRRDGRACFELDCGYRLQGGAEACDYTAAFRSIIGWGNVTEVQTPEEKRRGLSAIMAQATGRADWTFTSGQLEAVCVLRLDVEELSCKEHL